MKVHFWHDKVKADLSQVVNMIDFYSKELYQAKTELVIKGRIETHSSQLPGIIENRFNQLQDIEAVLENLNIKYQRLRAKKFRQFFENANIGRSLSSRDCDRYVDCDDEVGDLAELVNEVALIRNQFLGVIKGLENKSFQINNITKLRSCGIEDAEI